MNAWEGQVLAIALKELFEAVKTLRLGGDKRELSELIRDLLSVEPNVNKSQALLDALEARSGGRPSPDLFVAKRLLAAIRKQRLLEADDAASRKGAALISTPPRRPGPIPGARRRCRPRSSGSFSIPPPEPRPRFRRPGRPGDLDDDRDAPRRRRAAAEGRSRRRARDNDLVRQRARDNGLMTIKE
jgi:hypothetical protein